MIEVKKTYELEYEHGGYLHTIALVSEGFQEAITLFEANFPNATLQSITFGGPICL